MIGDIIIGDIVRQYPNNDINVADFEGLCVVDKANNIVPGVSVFQHNGTCRISLTPDLPLYAAAGSVSLAYTDGSRLFAVSMHHLFVVRPGAEIFSKNNPAPAASATVRGTKPLDTAAVLDIVKPIVLRIASIDSSQFDTLVATTSGHLCGDFGFDSLDLVDFLESAESSFGIDIPDDESATCVRLDDVVSLLLRKGV